MCEANIQSTKERSAHSVPQSIKSQLNCTLIYVRRKIMNHYKYTANITTDFKETCEINVEMISLVNKGFPLIGVIFIFANLVLYKHCGRQCSFGQMQNN